MIASSEFIRESADDVNNARAFPRAMDTCNRITSYLEQSPESADQLLDADIVATILTTRRPLTLMVAFPQEQESNGDYHDTAVRHLAPFLVTYSFNDPPNVRSIVTRGNAEDTIHQLQLLARQECDIWLNQQN